jgi:hypothetical protein
MHRLAAEVPGQGKFGLEVRKKPGQQLLTREQLRAQAAAAKRGEAAASGSGKGDADGDGKPGGLLANLALLQKGTSGLDEGNNEDAVAADASESVGAPAWKPPEGQRGDGRTKLNDLLGY